MAQKKGNKTRQEKTTTTYKQDLGKLRQSKKYQKNTKIQRNTKIPNKYKNTNTIQTNTKTIPKYQNKYQNNTKIPKNNAKKYQNTPKHAKNTKKTQNTKKIPQKTPKCFFFQKCVTWEDRPRPACTCSAKSNPLKIGGAPSRSKVQATDLEEVEGFRGEDVELLRPSGVLGSLGLRP